MLCNPKVKLKGNAKNMTKSSIETTKEKLNKVSSSFCLAKWKQVTIHLQTGMTHSCHHPTVHKIPISELKQNFSALHNTNFKKQQRKLMLEGIRPSECDYCWKIEDNTVSNYSDRHFKSNAPWAKPHFDEVKSLPWDSDVYPSYLEVSFSHACNFKCSYCSPTISSTWMKEIKQHGAYPTSGKFNNLEWFKRNNEMPIPVREYNPYVEAFWKWWPEVYPHLSVFRITGGEPLMTKDTFKALDYFIENPNKNLEFAVNTNLGVEKKLLDRFISKMQIISEKETVGSLKIYTSIDSWGERGAYIRNGMDFNYFWSNVIRVLEELPKCHLTFMCTFNALSVTKFLDFLKEIRTLKFTYNNKWRPEGVFVDTPYLRHPTHQSIKILTKEYIPYVEDMITYMKDNQYIPGETDQGFHEFEIIRMSRIHDFMMADENPHDIMKWRADFYRFFNEHDKRRNTNFLEIFPEMEDFWNLCKSSNEE